MDIGSPEWTGLIVEGAAVLGVALRPEHARLFARHATMLLKWNTVTNLTAVARPEDVARNHFLDSLAPARLIAPGSRMLDVGSGGGFPGVPLHIAVEGLQTTLIDAARKKVSFLRHALREMALSGIVARHQRVEELGRSGGRGSFDVVTSRAFAALAPFVRAAWPLRHPEGRVIAFKGDISAAEMDALREVVASGELGEGIVLEQVAYALPGLKRERNLLIVGRRRD
jgi:16S rRNA (guanine527-N7)-methyltransferase